MVNSNAINVSKTYLPEKKKYLEYVDQIFASGWITNNGLLHEVLEQRLSAFLDIPYLVLTANATIALQIAYELLDLKKEVITTPFSFIATTSSLLWKGLTPIFADIEPSNLNVDPEQIKSKITPNTEAILPVHTYGNACQIEAIEHVSKKIGIPVIYDASHCFGIQYENESILKQGAISIISFHAAKIFHTVEGGGLVLHSHNDYEQAKRIINNGIQDKETISRLGTNAKMSEFHAAMGLSILDEIEKVIPPRKKIHDFYMDRLENVKGIDFPKYNQKATRNYCYFPIILPNEPILKAIEQDLNSQNIFPRRYFYPPLHQLAFLKNFTSLPVTEHMAPRILCLPIYAELSKKTQSKIIQIVQKHLSRQGTF